MVAALISSMIYAQAVKKLSTIDEMTYSFSAVKVWKTIGDFNGLNQWHPAVLKSEIISGKNNKVGAVRLLTLGNGDQLYEKLLSYSARKMLMTYDIHKGNYPATDYIGVLKVIPLGKEKCKVVWNATLRRKDHSSTPKEGEDDETAIAITKKIHNDGLQNLQKVMETKDNGLSQVEKDFISKFAEVYLFAIKLGQLANQNSTNKLVNEFGNMNITMHQTDIVHLQRLATKKGIILPTELKTDFFISEIKKFEKLKDKDFDRAYAENVYYGHEAAIKEFVSVNSQTHDPELSDFIAFALPTLKLHLKQSKHIQQTLAGES